MKTDTLNIRSSVRASLLLVSCALVVSTGSNQGGILRRLSKRPSDARLVQLPISVAVRPGLRLEIVELKHFPNDVVEVTMRNGYEQDITAIAASTDDHQSFHTDYVYAEAEANQKLLPGATDTFLYSPTRIGGATPQIVVSAVVFSDGTKRGDQGEVGYILDKRLGMKIQLNRINPYLERLASAKSSTMSLELRYVIAITKALAIDDWSGSALSPGLEYGLIHGRAFILNYLSKLDTVLQSGRIESYYKNGLLQNISHSGEDEFRTKALPRIRQDFKTLASRL